jgi:hypothetical protein
MTTNDEEQQPTPSREISHLEETHARQVIQYTDGTVREDFKAEGLNTFLGSARPRAADDKVGEPFEPNKPREARTSHPLGWVRFGGVIANVPGSQGSGKADLSSARSHAQEPIGPYWNYNQLSG